MKNRIREFRRRAKLTARELGVKVGVSEQTITAWERGTRAMSLDAAKRVLAALGMRSLDALCAEQRSTK